MSGASTSETLSPTPPVECLSMRGRPRWPRLEPVAAVQHGLGERRGFGAIEPAEEARHEERRHLVVGDVALGVGKGERAPFPGLDAPPSRFRSISRCARPVMEWPCSALRDVQKTTESIDPIVGYF